jgi:hypothetical protein
MVTPVVGDLEKFTFDTSMAAGLIVGFSAVEHGSSITAMHLCSAGVLRPRHPAVW